MARPLVSETVQSKGGRGYPYRRPRLRNENTYSAEDKAKGLVTATLVGSRKAAEWLPIPHQTLHDWLHGRGINDEIINMAKHFAEELSGKLANIANLIADDMPNKVGKAGLQQQAIALGVVIDKRQLLEGLPTAIQETQGLSTEERAAKIKELMERAKDRKAAE